MTILYRIRSVLFFMLVVLSLPVAFLIVEKAVSTYSPQPWHGWVLVALVMAAATVYGARLLVASIGR